jgi:predicted TIM-barrel fold metal-dependent hydrolase
MLGRSAIPQPGAPVTAEGLIEALHANGIGSALVYHADAAEYSYQVGNERLLEAIAGHGELKPCWVLGPYQTGELPPPDKLVPQMLENGVHAVLFCPGTHRYRFRVWNLEPLLERLAAHRIPVWVDFGLIGWSNEVIDWDGVHDVCSAFPELPIVLVRANIGSNRRLFPLIERCPNLRIDTSYYTVHRGIEVATRMFGAQRLIFGTGFPMRPPGPAITGLTYSLINDEERALIGGGNLRALLAGVTA